MSGKRGSWTDEQLRQAVPRSFSVAQVLRELGLRPAGGNYDQVRVRVKALDLDTSHWTGQAHWRGKHQPRAPRRSLAEILRPGTMFQSHKLRKRLIAAGVFNRICENCGLTEWLGQKVPLELDHIDGDRANHEISNLRLLCPNCHSQTATYRGRNIRRRSTPRLEQPRACYFKLPV